MPDNLEQEIKDDNQTVAGWMLYYHQRKREYVQARAGVLLSSPAPADGQPRGTETTDTTGRKGSKLAQLHERTGAWLELVEEIEARLPPKMRIILIRRRECVFAGRKKYRGRPAWIPYVQVKYAEDVAKLEGKRLEDVWVNNPDKFGEWWRRIIDYGVRCALKKNLL